MAEVIIPPDIRPESPVEIELVDDLTRVFSPAFGRGIEQRQTDGDPRWSMKLRYRGLNEADRARLKRAVQSVRGKYLSLLVTPGIEPRGTMKTYAREMCVNPYFAKGLANLNRYTQDFDAYVVDQTYVSRGITGTSPSAGSYPLYGYPGNATPTLTSYAPYVLRVAGKFALEGAVYTFRPDDWQTRTVQIRHSQEFYSMVSWVETASMAEESFGISSAPWIPNEQISVYMFSVSRCGLVDAAPNRLTYSNKSSEAAWIPVGSSVGDNGTDGTYDSYSSAGTGAQRIVENTATSQHGIATSITGLQSDHHEWSCSVSLHSGIRTIAYLQIIELTSGSSYSVEAYVNLSTGAFGTNGTSAGFKNLRLHIVAEGNGWYRATITCTKTGSWTSASMVIGCAVTDGSAVYAGSGGSSPAILFTEASFSVSSCPTWHRRTLSSNSPDGVAPSGDKIYLKGLPASETGLLLPGDFFEVNGELKQVTEPVSSDAAGKGIIRFRPALFRAPANDTPVIFNNPFGRFMLKVDPRLVENFGKYTDLSIDLVEVYE